jgi:hypothetical protein
VILLKGGLSIIDRDEEKEYCYCEYKETSSHAYEAVLEVCKHRGITEVHDIGCGFAFQALMFSRSGIVYFGIESDSGVKPYVPEGTNLFYKFMAYPCECPCLTHPCHTAAISSLCVGYLCGGKETWKNMAQTCEYFIGDIPKEEYAAMEEYYYIQQVYHFSDGIDILFCKRQEKENQDFR